MSARSFFVLLLFNVNATAQTGSKDCDCSLLLRESIQKVTTIYAGFGDKVTAGTRLQYNKLVGDLEAKASKPLNGRGCFEIIKRYTDWFRDLHVGIWFSVQSSPGAIRKFDTGHISHHLKIPMGGLEGGGLEDGGLEGLWCTSTGSTISVLDPTCPFLRIAMIGSILSGNIGRNDLRVGLDPSAVQ